MRKTIKGDGQLYLHYVWITLQLYPLTPCSGFSVQLILIKFTVATNTTHVKILSSVLKCMYMYTHLCLCVCVCQWWCERGMRLPQIDSLRHTSPALALAASPAALGDR